MSKKVSSLICFVLVLGLAGSALALDDLNPPFWRNGPGTMYAHWEFSTDPNLGPDPNQVEADEYKGYTVNHVDAGSLWYAEGPGTVTNAAMAWYGDSNYVWYGNFQGRTGVIEPNLYGPLEYLTLFVLNNWPADPNRNKRLRVQTVVYAETLDDFNLPVWTEAATADGVSDIWIPGPQRVAPPSYDPEDEEDPEDPEYWQAFRLVEVVPLPGEPNWYHMTVDLEFFDGAGEDTDATNPGAETFFLLYWEEGWGEHPFWIDEVIFDTICYDTVLEGWGPSNASPVYDEDHVLPTANLSFQAPWNAQCMNPDPNYDPNLTGPFEYDVYFGLEPNVLTMTQIADACVPTNCNDVMTFDPCAGDLADATVFYWRVDINDTDAINGAFYEGTYLKFRTWGFVDNVAPPNEAINVAPPVLLKWAPDGYAATCDVYFGTSYAEVDSADSTDTTGIYKTNKPVSDPNYNAGMLDLAKTYYWRIDEKNGGGTAVKGAVCSFTTGSYFVVEDFDRYPSNTQLYAVWDDYWANGTGSEVFIEQDANFTRDGNSMMFKYDCGTDYKKVGAIADADIADMLVGGNWTIAGIRSMVLYFYGDPCNSVTTNDRMWVQLEDTSSNAGAKLYGDGGGEDPNDVKLAGPIEWNIDLNDANFSGVSLANIGKIHIGFGGPPIGQSKAGGTGTVYFDDIQLHPQRCRPELVAWDIAEGDCITDGYDLALMGGDWLAKDYQVFPVPPDRNNLVLEYLFDPCVAHQDLYDSSGNGRHGQPSGSLWSVANGYLTIEAAGGYVDIPFGADNPFHGPNDFSVIMEYRNSSAGNTALLTSTDPCIPMSWEDPNVEDAFALYSPMALIAMQVAGKAGNPDDVNFAYDNFYKAGSDVGIDVVGGIGSWHYVGVTYDADGGICPAEPWDPNACPPGTVSGLITVYLDTVKGTDPLVMDPNIPVDANYDVVRIGDGYTPLHGEDWGFGPHIGDINEILIFDVALTEAEVYYLSGKTGATYVPNTSLANIVPKTPPPTSYDANDPDIVNFIDFDFLAAYWLAAPLLWP
ncbi:MAG: hypothetical protein JSV99_12060 [Planctomycetota bacterium]|nr:MAG: hypothetical protein JSV99_12060 [Planctomycetota bacterium]